MVSFTYIENVHKSMHRHIELYGRIPSNSILDIYSVFTIAKNFQLYIVGLSYENWQKKNIFSQSVYKMCLCSPNCNFHWNTERFGVILFLEYLKYCHVNVVRISDFFFGKVRNIAELEINFTLGASQTLHLLRVWYVGKNNETTLKDSIWDSACTLCIFVCYFSFSDPFYNVVPLLCFVDCFLLLFFISHFFSYSIRKCVQWI